MIAGLTPAQRSAVRDLWLWRAYLRNLRAQCKIGHAPKEVRGALRKWVFTQARAGTLDNVYNAGAQWQRERAALPR